MYLSMVWLMISGEISAVADEMRIATNAMRTFRPSPCISGTRRESAVQIGSVLWLASEVLSL